MLDDDDVRQEETDAPEVARSTTEIKAGPQNWNHVCVKSIWMSLCVGIGGACRLVHVVILFFNYTCDVKTTHAGSAELQAGAQVIDSWQRHGNGKLPALPWLQQSGIWVTTDHLTDKARRKDASASGSAPTGHVVHVGDRGAAEFLPVAMAYRSLVAQVSEWTP